MAYRLKRKESVPTGIVRVAQEQIDKAVGELTDEQMDRHEAVHQVRKRFKKIRAVLRLVRFELGDVYGEENAWFRDTARTLSRVRDAEAMIETAEMLRERFGEEFDADAYERVRRTLVERRQRIAEEEVDLDRRASELAEELKEVRRRVGEWPLSVDAFGALHDGLKQTYRRGRKAMARAYGDPSAENFHEWRKRVKYHWYHARLLRNVWPRMMDSYRKAVHHLSNLLGDHHDLDVFRETLLEDPRRFGGKAKVQRALKLGERLQAELRARARALGRRIYSEKPGKFCARMEGYWEAWKTEL